MQIHQLIQGTPEWHAYRATHFNASNAPAMMGVSSYKTRSQLLLELHTGLAPEVDAATQRRFDDGHRFEALGRPLAEAIIGEDLYPVTGSSAKLSASFDGLTMAEDIAYEHKTLNDDLRAAMVDGCTGADLPLMYQIQMEQQCLVSGAARILFMASTWAGDDLVEERHCWYVPNAELRAKIVAGWEQFAKDLAEYMPPAVVVESVGRAPESLPALRIEVTGMVTASNLAEFKAAAVAVFKGLNRDLATDQQFADAEKTMKWCGDVEDRLAAAKQHALSQTETIDALFRAIDEISAEARATRLELDKLVKARKETIRTEILQEGLTAFGQHVASLNARLGKPYMPAVPTDFAGAMKGKKTVSSLRDAVDTVLATAKIEANAIADRIQFNLATLRELAFEHAFLFPDTSQIVLKGADDLTALVKTRIAEHKEKEEKRLAAQREQIRIEEEAKAAAKAKAEQEQAERQAQAEAQVVIQQAAAPVVIPTAVPAAAPAPAPAAQADLSSDVCETMKLGEIAEHLGFALPATFLSQLGFEPVGRERSAILYRASEFPRICNALVQHIQAACVAQPA